MDNDPTFHEWLAQGQRLRYASLEFCDTHDGVPMNEEELQEWDNGNDPCFFCVRLQPYGAT